MTDIFALEAAWGVIIRVTSFKFRVLPYFLAMVNPEFDCFCTLQSRVCVVRFSS